MSTVYVLQSDKQFIRTNKENPDVVYVYEYKGDPNAFGIIYADNSRWGVGVLVGDSAGVQFKELEVLGVKIGGDQLKELAKDLTIVDNNGSTFRLMVNRRGLCLLLLASTSSVTWMRNNDRFGWSKYGVKTQNDDCPVWSICDMSNGDVLVDRDDGECCLRKVVEEKEKEVASLKAALRALIADK